LENPLKYSLTTRFKDSRIFGLLEIAPGERLLDVGCGIGYLCELGREAGALVYGMDKSRQALHYAAATVEGKFAAASAEGLPFRSNSFDKIIFADVIEHVPDDQKVLREIVRVARPGARIVISTPALEGVFTRTWLKTLLHGEEDEFQKNYREGYTADSLAALMRDCHIGDSEVVYTNFFLSEIFLGLTKISYALKKKSYNSQADLVDLSASVPFRIYKSLLFPVFLSLGRLEEWLVRRWVKGHCLIVGGTINKGL